MGNGYIHASKTKEMLFINGSLRRLLTVLKSISIWIRMLMLSTYFSTHIFFAAIQVYVDTSSKEEMQMIKIDFDKDSHDT